MNNTLSNTELTHIQDGMDVIDVTGEKIGTVEFIRFGDEGYNNSAPETNEAYYEGSEDTFIDIVAQVFDPISIPKEIQARMYRHGFLKIETGLFSDDRYVLLDNVASIHNDKVQLSINKDQLFSL